MNKLHTAVFGRTGEGKTTAMTPEVEDRMCDPDCSVVVIDPKTHFAERLLVGAELNGCLHRVFFDRYSEFDRALGSNWIIPSLSNNPFQRDAEEEELCFALLEPTWIKQGKQNLDMSPLKKEFAVAALRVMLSQEAPVPPLSAVQYLFEQDSDKRPNWNRRYLLQRARNKKAAQKFYDVPGSWSSVRRELAPAERLIMDVFGNSLLLARDGGNYDHAASLNAGNHLITGAGGVSDDGARTLNLLRIIQTGFAARNGCSKHIYLVIDEALDYIGQGEANYLIRFLSQLRAFNITIILIFQNVPRDPAITDAILTNCGRIIVHACGGYTAEVLGREIGTRMLDPNQISHYDSRTRTVIDGYDEIDTTSVATRDDGMETNTRGKSYRPRHRDEQERNARYRGLEDQVRLWTQRIMNLGKRQRIVAEGGQVWQETVPEILNPWGLNELLEERANAILTVLKQRPEYHTPTLSALELPITLPSSSPASASPTNKQSRQGSSPRTAAPPKRTRNWNGKAKSKP